MQIRATSGHPDLEIKLRLNKAYAAMGGLAVLTGASLAAFTAKQPSTLAMWASAYLLLVVGFAQIFLAVAVAELLAKNSRRLVNWIFVIFNLGNALVILSTALKYSGHEQHVIVTIAGAAVIIATLSTLSWQVRLSQKSYLKLATYVLVGLLISTSLIGMILAAVH